jgi:hypothetical protein
VNRFRLLAVLLALAACTRPSTIPPVTLPFVADTARAEVIAPGVIHRYIRSSAGPWAIHALDVDLSRCYSAVAVKGAPGAAGRRRTSDLLTDLSRSREVVGGVNADFFTLAGFQGVPTGALISGGRVIVGPSVQPLLSVDSSGRPRLGVLNVAGAVTHRGQSRPIAGWNRTIGNRMSVYDRRWGAGLDTASGIIEVVIEGAGPGRVSRIDTGLAGVKIPDGGSVIVVGRNAPEGLRQWVSSFAAGDTVQIALGLTPFHPMEAVGGRPMLARDSAIAPEVETEGQVSFRNRNPRTAAGISNDGRRLILAVVDGRQPGYSDGMTLRETATLMLALGARDAINLDGGGSSALVYRSADGSLRLGNHPSDAAGERAVGDALAIVKGCR